jgi:DNA-binding protein WhiA
MNCDQANMNKQLRTSEEQLSAIHNIAASVGLEVLPGKLYEIAQLRIHEPDATLKQLGDMLTPALSKSGVYHRLVQINKISTQLN